MRAHASRPLGLMLALAMLLPLVLVTGTMGASLPARAAESSAPPYATAKLEKVADGTGHGTAAQSFVNSKNGFAPGDDSPTDGVVASGDTVEYRIRLEFTAARKRTVDVRFDMGQAPMLDSIVGGSFCTNGRLVTAKRSGDTCSYTVPAGAVESMTQSVVMRARDTGGKAVADQLVTAGVSRDGGEETVYRADPVTVVSAPAADLEVDNGGMPDNQRSVERRLSWSDGGTADGWFDLKVVQLHYQGYSSHGASTQGAWSGTIDVSEFPANTTWTMDGKPLTVSNGKIKVSGLTGGKQLSYSFKYADMAKPMEKDTTQYLAIGVETDEGSFSTGEGDDVLMNLGDGSEPGRGMGRDESTYDAKTGAIRGYPYANNNWSRAIIDRYDPPAGAIFWKTLEKPDANGYTIFDEENRSFENANDSGQTVYHSGYADKVSQGTQVRTILHAYAERITGCADRCGVIMGDNWDRNSSWLGDLKVTMGGVDISPEDYTLEWTTKRADASDETAGWRTGEPDPKTARGMRVKLSDSLPFGGEAGAGTLEISFLVTASGDPGQSNVTASDAMTGTFANAVNVEGSKIDSDYYVIVAPGTPAAAADYSVAVTDPDGNRRDDARPGDTVSWSTGDGLRVLNVQSSKTALAPRVTVCVAAGTLDPVNDNLQWKMTRKPGSDGCAYNLEFTLANPVTPSYSQSGQASLPMVKWHGTVANKASGSPQSSLVLHVDGAQVGTIPGFSVEATASASYVVSKASGSAGVVGADQTKVEIDDPIRFHWNIYKKDSNLKGSMRTVLKLPSNKDAAMTGTDNKGPDGSWNEYDMGSSKFEGTLALAGEPTLDGDNSTDTMLRYSTQDLNSENPDDYTWKSWNQLSDSERAQVKAILVTSEPEALDGTNLAASRGSLTLQPKGNTEKDKYNLWIGANRVDASTENVPWPAQTVVVMGSISGTVWWDRNENTLQGKDEDTIPGIEVSLWKVGQDGNKTGDKPFATTSTDDKGYYLFDHLHSGSYMTEVKRSEGTVTDDGVQTTVTTYYGQSKPVSNTRSWSNRLKEDAKDNSDRINLTIDQDLKHVDYGYAKPDPKATLDKKTTSVKCKDGDNKDDQYCDITWDVAVENKGKTTSEPSLDITAATGSNLLDSAEGSLVASSDGAWLVRPDGSTIKVQGVTGSITAAIGDWPLESNDGSLVVSSDGAWLVRPDGSTIKVQGVTGSITAATGIYPLGSTFGSLVVSSDGAWLVKPDGSTIKVQGVTGSITAAIGDWPLNSNGGSLVVSSDGAWLVKPDGSTIKVQGATGSITTATGVHPLGSTFGSLVASSDGAWLVKPDGSTIKVQGATGSITTATGNWPLKESDGGSLVVSSDGAWLVKPDGSTIKVQGATGSITTATGNWPLKESDGGSLVVSSDGAWLVRPDGSTIKVQGATGSITAATGIYPLGSTFGSLVASSDGAWLVKPDGSTIKVQGATGSITTATGNWPLKESDGGSLVVSSDGAWLVKPDGSTIKVQGATGSITTATGVHPLGSTLGSLVASSDGAWLVKPDGSTIKVQGLSGGVDDSESTSGTSVFPTSSTLSDRMSDMVSDVSATAGTESVEPGGADRASSTANHTLYWDSQSGAGYASGYNMYGQLGTGDTSNSSTPLPIDGAWKQLAAGGMHSAGVSLDGGLYVWGSDSNGQLGTGDATDRNTPTQVQQGTQFTAVAAGADFTVAAKTDGGVMMAGRGKDSWSEVNAGVRFAQLSAFGDTWLGITEAGELYQGSGSGAASANASGTTFLMADAGDDHNLALDSENHVWAWGSSNSHRQQGGSSSNSSPTKVSALADKQFTQVSAGYLSSMLVESGTNHVWSWGWDGYGQLADGNAHDGRAWDNGSAITGNIVSTPADTGLTANWVEMSYQHSVIIGDKVREAGYDAYGSTAMTGSGNPVDTGLKGAGKSTDPTAVPVEPISETTADGYATRVYNLPFTVQPGGRVVFHFKGRVQRDKAEKLAVNQAWFDSPDTPYSGTPNAGGKTTPDLPDASKHDETTDDIVGNTTCRADADYKLDGQQHWFSSGNEDSCDQVGVPIPAVTQVKPGAPKGSISGLYWRDTDEDGVRDADETERIPGQQVVLFDKDGAQVAVTETNERGEYSFTGLRYGEYTVQFSQVKRSPFTKADVNDTDIPNDAGRADSDAKTGEDDYGEASPTIVLNTAKPDWTDVDAGVTPSAGWLSGMPFTGQGQWVVLVAVAAVMLLAGSAILLRGSRK